MSAIQRNSKLSRPIGKTPIKSWWQRGIIVTGAHTLKCQNTRGANCANSQHKPKHQATKQANYPTGDGGGGGEGASHIVQIMIEMYKSSFSVNKVPNLRNIIWKQSKTQTTTRRKWGKWDLHKFDIFPWTKHIYMIVGGTQRKSQICLWWPISKVL